MIEKHFDDESVPEVSLSDLFNKFICSLKDQRSNYYNFTIITDTHLVIRTVSFRRNLLISNLLPRIKEYALD